MVVELDLSSFWEVLEESFPLAGPRAHLIGQLGAEVVNALEAGGLLSVIRVEDRYPCPRPGGDGCPRYLLRNADGTFLAVCGNDPPECEDLDLTEQDVTVLGLSPERLCQAMRAPLLFGGRIEQLRDLRHVYRAGGFKPLPGVSHVIYFVSCCSEVEYSETIDALRSRHDGGGFAVLVPTDRYVAADTRRQMGSLGIPIISLHGLLRLGTDGVLSTDVSVLDLFSAIGRRASLPAPGQRVYADALTHRGWEQLDEAGYRRLVDHADEYEIFADERTRTVWKREAGRKAPGRRMGIRESYFHLIREAAEAVARFDPIDDPRHEEQAAVKQTFQRARQVFDRKCRDEAGAASWRLFKSAKSEDRVVYLFRPDPDCKFALLFLPRS